MESPIVNVRADLFDKMAEALGYDIERTTNLAVYTHGSMCDGQEKNREELEEWNETHAKECGIVLTLWRYVECEHEFTCKKCGTSQGNC